MNKYLIYHIFADMGVESEVLGTYGEVVRVGLNIRDLNDSDPIQADARFLPLEPNADLVLLHPPCTRWSSMTSISGDPDDHPNLIPLARSIGKEYGTDYIIENQPRAPLENPVFLEGGMFGLPIKYRRAFETSFPVEAPPLQQKITNECSPYFYSDRTRTWWESIKGVHEWYPKSELARGGIPAPYVHHLCRAWLRSLDTRDSKPVTGHEY